MCFGSPKVDKSAQKFSQSEALRARTEENARQSRIGYGMDQIAAIFDGGRAPTLNRATGAYDPTQTYYTSDGSLWTPTRENKKGLFKELDGEKAAALFANSGPLFTRGDGAQQAGMAPLLAARSRAMRSFYMPQLRQELNKTRDDLTYSLARAGLIGSTVARDRSGDLNEGFNLQRSSILSDIAADQSRTRSAINDQRASLEAALRASGDATAATNSALSARTAFAADSPQLDPLGNVLASFAEGIGAGVNGYRSGQIRSAARGSAPASRDLSRVV